MTAGACTWPLSSSATHLHIQMDRQLFHLVAAELWQAAKEGQQPYFPATYPQDGFIHLTGDPAFLLKVANHFYRDSPHQEWLLLVLDPAKLTAKVVYEPAAAVGNKPTFSSSDDQQGQQQQAQEQEAGPLFPHLVCLLHQTVPPASTPTFAPLLSV